jgi:hypothetical protein
MHGAFAELGLPGLVEASRRGGHLWFLLDEPMSAVALRFVVAEALAQLAAWGVEIPAHELYPDISAIAAPAKRLGHAVRLPLGVHRKTGVRYPLFDADGLPCAFTSIEKAAVFVLEAPRIAAEPLRERWQSVLADRKAAKVGKAERGERSRRAEPVVDVQCAGTRVGTRSAVIRWVDAHVSQLDLLAELAPEAEMRRVGHGYIGWCPFHNDRAPDEVTGEPGSPSFYVVQDRRYGWSWRCLSANCAQSAGLMRHSFCLLQELLGISVAAAICEAVSRFPAADARADASGEDPEDSDEGDDEGKEIADDHSR